MFTLEVVKAYDKIMEEEETRVLLINGKKYYEADGLFFKYDLKYNKILEVLEKEEVSEDPSEFCERAIELRKKYGLKVFDDSFDSMTYWQCVNGVTDKPYMKGMPFDDWLNSKEN